MNQQSLTTNAPASPAASAATKPVRLMSLAGGKATARQMLLVIRQRTRQRDDPGYPHGRDLPVVHQQDE